MIVFSNQGTIDPLAITTMGVNAKTSKSAIGIFGTGLKFAIAVLARHGCGVHIISGGVEYTFSARPVKIRDQDFEIVQMSTRTPAIEEGLHRGAYVLETRDLGFTTALGLNWKLWHAYRELYCNCVTDEGGAVTYMPDAPVAAEGDDVTLGVAPDHTAVIVTGEAFDQIHEDRHDFILNRDRVPFLTIPDVVDVYRGGSHVVFYKGIKVGEIQGGEGARYTYNVKSWMYLSEDREMILHSQFTDAVKAAVLSGLDLGYVKDVIITVNEDGSDREGIEAKLDFTANNISDGLFAMIRDAILATKERVSKTLRGSYIRYERDNLISRAIALSEGERAKFVKIIDDLKRIGFEFDGEIRVVSDLGTNVTTDGDDKVLLVAIDALNADDTIRYDIIQQMLYQTRGFQKNGASVVKFLVDRLWEIADAKNEPLAFKPTAADVELMVEEPVTPAAPADVYVMIGVWSQNNKVAYREIVDEATFEKLKHLDYINYTDGTTLTMSHEKTAPVNTFGVKMILGYADLVRDAARKGTRHVNVKDL